METATEIHTEASILEGKKVRTNNTMYERDNYAFSRDVEIFPFQLAKNFKELFKEAHDLRC